MTELEIIETLAKALPERYRIEFRPDQSVGLFDESGIPVNRWPSIYAFLFGYDSPAVDSFFSWLIWWTRHLKFGVETAWIVRDILSAAPWLVSLAGCSSTDEIELKMTVMGLLGGKVASDD